MPKISVIVPVYKVEPYLRRCVDSILNQSFNDFELILIDDGSPDNCPGICDEYAKNDNRIVVIHKKNGGLSSARNAGLDYVRTHSKSEYISFVDSDDWVNETYLETLLHLFDSESVDITICNAARVSNKDSYEYLPAIKEKVYDSEELLELSICESYIFTTAWGKLYKKDVINKNNFKLNRIGEDEFFANDLYKKHYKVKSTNAYLYLYFNNPNGIMNTLSSRSFDQADALIQRLRLLPKRATVAKRKYLNVIYSLILSYNKQEKDCKSSIKYKKILRCIKIIPFDFCNSLKIIVKLLFNIT